MSTIRNFRQIGPLHLCSKIVIGDKLVDWSEVDFHIIKQFPQITIKESSRKYWIILKYGPNIFSLDVLLKKNTLILLAKSEVEKRLDKKAHAEINITRAFSDLPDHLDLDSGKISYGNDTVEISFEKRGNFFQKLFSRWY